MAVTRNPNLGPSQMRQRRRRLFLVRLSIVTFFVLVVIFGLAIFSGSKKVTIQTIIVSGNAAISSDQVLTVANQAMSGRYFYLFAKNNYMIFPRFQMRKNLLSEIKTIKDLDISWQNWQTISIVITERKPHSVWCGVDTKIADAPCYFVDKEGYIYSKAPVFSGSMFIKGYGIPLISSSASSSDIGIGQYFLPKQIYADIFSLVQLLDQRNIKVVSLSFDGSDFKFILENGPEIIFNNMNSSFAQVGFSKSFQNLFSAIETKDLDLDKNADKIKYIDLRFDNKIIIGKK